MQNVGGGVQMRIGKMYQYLRGSSEISQVKLFDKWNDKIIDFDILHIFKDTIDSLELMAYAKAAGVKIVMSSVIPQMHSIKIRGALLLKRISKIHNTHSMLRKGLSMSDCIIAQTIQEADFISKVYNINSEKIQVIPNGVKEELLDNYNPSISKSIVLCVGRFDRNKNQLSLIKAMKGLGIPLHFVGGPAINEANYYEECRRTAGNDCNIIFHDWLSNESAELLELYQRAKVVALISHKEIFGNSLIEGAAAGANLVASKCIPTKEWNFDEHCINVIPTSVNNIRAGVIEAFNMPISTSIHEQTVEQFSWQNVVERYIGVYKSLH